MSNVYSTLIGSYKQSPILEILENEKPLGEKYFGLKEHFVFGKIKARLILCCIETIKQFSDTDGHLPGAGEDLLLSNEELDLNCVITHHSSFRSRTGGHVEKPYLEIRDQYGNTINFGRKRAQAIVDTEADIRKFALS